MENLSRKQIAELRKNSQLDENKIIENIVDKINAEIENSMEYLAPLRYCQAWVYVTDNYYILRSYHTIVAAVDRTSRNCYDFLRYVYGYTATSAQHIAKFFRDYSPWTFGGDIYRWYYVKK